MGKRLRTKWVVFVAGLIGASACAQPLMNVPGDLAGKVDVYPVHGRQGLLLFDPAISFGPYRTMSIHRGVVASERSSVATGVFSSETHDSDRQQLDFVLQSSIAGSWRGRCLAYSEQRSQTRVTGVHFGSEGSGFTEEQTPVSASSGYRCQLDGPAGEHWKLETDEHFGEGTVQDEAGEAVADIQRIGEPWSWNHQALEGNAIVSRTGEMWAAVQRSFDGAVYLSRELDPKQRAATAAICLALLIAGQ
jgi:hypothetical protein